MDKIKPQITKIEQNEVLLRDETDWLIFRDAYRVIRAGHLEEVKPALRQVEELVAANDWYAAGFLSYEAAPAFDPALRTRAAPDFPLLWFGLYPAPRAVAIPSGEGPSGMLDWRPTTERDDYHAAIAAVKKEIGAGRTYQVNYTMRLQTAFEGNAWEFFLQLAGTQNRHAAYIDTGRYVICSASPELFFRREGSSILCQPMKGTAGRGRTTAEDREAAAGLLNSEKDRAENVMIVDMIRNDLGRIAKTGTVQVSQLFELERYPTLWQMTSTVTARTDVSLVEIFSALFPSASITGAPKVSTMGIIADLESSPRRIYTGSLGYIAPQRRAKFNVAIRTALVDRANAAAVYGVGGGIVWDSTAETEYQEALLKAQVLSQARTAFSLLETLRWTPQEGYYLREKHIARLIDSADYFDFPVSAQVLHAYLDQIASGFSGPQRIRLLLDETGRLRYEADVLEITGSAEVLKAGLAVEPVNSQDVFLFHKTTRRDVYDRAQEGFGHLDDVLLYNERNEATEFTRGNLVVELEGRWLTPPVSCGLLAGTLRAHLLESGQVWERVIPVAALPLCTRIFSINSVRGQRLAQIEPVRQLAF